MSERTLTAILASRRGALACVICSAVLTAACADSAASGAPLEDAADAAESRTIVAVVDFSGSQTTHAVAEGKTYLEKVVNGLGFGDRLVLLEMYRSGPRDSVGMFVQDMPDPIRSGAVTSYDRRQLNAARRGVLNALPIFFDPDLVRSVPTTDLLTTMHIAAEHLRDSEDDVRQIILLSDMLQSTPRFEFEGGRRMPTEGWVEEQARQRLLPALEGACVLVIGADHTTPEGQRVREFWSDYFAGAGARLGPGDYRLRAPTEPVAC